MAKYKVMLTTVASFMFRKFFDLLVGSTEDRQAKYEADEVAAAAERWREHNRRAREAGCKCGRPATHVRRFGGTVGGVPYEVWTCEEHVNVNSWSGHLDGTWTPAGDYDAASLAWEERQAERG